MILAFVKINKKNENISIVCSGEVRESKIYLVCNSKLGGQACGSVLHNDCPREKLGVDTYVEEVFEVGL